MTVGLCTNAARATFVTVKLKLLVFLEIRDLDTTHSPLAFVSTLVPSTIGLLVVEARTLSGRLQADMWSFQGTGR